MSKKNKRKFYSSPQAQPVNAVSSSQVPAVSSSSMPSTPINAGISEAHAQEYKVIKHDLIKVVILNALFLAGVLTLYYTNLNSHYLEKWFSNILHF